MELIDKTTRQPLVIGQQVKTSDGETYTLTGFQKPHKPASEGFVHIRPLGLPPGLVGEEVLYASCIGAEFYPRPDRKEW